MSPLPRIEVALIPRKREAAHPGLEIDHERLQAVRCRNHLLRAPRVQRALVETEDCEKENGEDNREAECDCNSGEDDSCEEAKSRP